MFSPWNVSLQLYHAGVDGGLLDVSGDAGDEGISVLKVGVEVRLREDEKIMITTQMTPVQTHVTGRYIMITILS